MKDEKDELSVRLYDFADFHGKLAGCNKVDYCPLISEGGDREFNGQGVMLSTLFTEWKDRNPERSLKEIEDIFKDKLGLNHIIWLPRGSYEDEHMYSGRIPDSNDEFSAYRIASANGHIDEICRFVSKDTVLLAEITEEEAKNSLLARLNKERLDKALSAIKKEKSINIVRMPFPEPIYVCLSEGDDAYEGFVCECKKYNGKLFDCSDFPKGEAKFLPSMSYCNFLITNGVVLAQTYYREGLPEKILEKDKRAIKILQRCFPARQVVGINSFSLNLYGGGIHCATRNVPYKSS